ncbi:TPA: hypothetical protein ACH3X1_003400 [Trebouxia sp. C0004]
MAKAEYQANGQEGLDQLLAALDGGFEGAGTALLDEPSALTKVVLARRSDVKFSGKLDPLALLHALQERDPRSYQIYLQLPDGMCFLGSTPEQLYARSGSHVASEAVAATRPRGPAGDVEKDFWYALDLLRCPKDHVEFTLVRDFVRDSLLEVCSQVKLDTEKSVLKQAAVQHLYGRLSGTLKSSADDAQLLAALHPTPAVCGRPRGAAKDLLASQEIFDRGFYSGPFGWLSGCAAEFVVAIRSALIHADPQMPWGSLQTRHRESSKANGNGSNNGSNSGSVKGNGSATAAAMHTISLYAGVGIVKGSIPEAEWQELELKARQFQVLLQPLPPLPASPNINLLSTRALVEELCRLGVNTFAVAPGSRSSALTLAVAMHPRARVMTCIDERSLGFWALGHARATGLPAAVITSSGTAVANLLPAVVEASQSNIPMLLITADRPSEMRDTGANQTIDQVKIFGGYTRWAIDVPPPDHVVPVRGLLTSADAAVRFATGTPAGPVHINCQFREPLAPAAADWPHSLLKGMKQWLSSNAPFSSHIKQASPSSMLAGSPGMTHLIPTLRSAERGLLVVAELTSPQDVMAALNISKALGWPVVADALSGLRVGMTEAASREHVILHHFDQVLLEKAAWPALKPDVVLQLGNHLVSKRVMQFLEWSALDEEDLAPMAWIHADASSKRLDEKYLVSQRVQMPLAHLAHLLSQDVSKDEFGHQAKQYRQLLDALNDVAHHEIDAWLSHEQHLSEPFVARSISEQLPSGNGLFIGNSMPVRDMDMYATWQRQCSNAQTSTSHAPARVQNSSSKPCQGVLDVSVGVAVGSNRGASGIDGVLSTAAGFAAGLKRPTTLVVGDVSFLHDINGLNMLRTGDLQAALTVVLVNNGGGGIFSFLPIADSLPPDIFTPLWATPQNVDLAGMCRAQGIAHQRVGSLEELSPALQSAWALHRHSVVEVITGRDSNVDQHRQLQAAVQQAVRHAMRLLTTSTPGSLGSTTCPCPMSVSSATWQRYTLPLQKPLTTGTTAHGRHGLMLQLVLKQGNHCFHGVGEVAPLPGLHTESIEQAEQQLSLVCHAVKGVEVPFALSMMQGRISSWIKHKVGLDPANLYPSVRCGLEGALLTTLAQAHNIPLAKLLHGQDAPLPSTSAHLAQPPDAVLVNGLLDWCDTIEACTQEALDMVAQGYSALKIKVGRQEDPLRDAAVLVAVRQAVGPGVVLRADANRKWSLNQAVAFGHAVKAAGLQYIEEPVQDTRDLAAFFGQTHIPMALDETLDEAFSGQGLFRYSSALGPEQRLQQQIAELGHGAVVALVAKPGMIGGFERAMSLSHWAASQGIKVIISSAFESSLGLAQYACLSHAVNELHLRPSQPSTSSVTRSQDKTSPVYMHCLTALTAHGLATESWFKHSPESDLVRLHGTERLAISLETAHSVLSMACSVYTAKSDSENVSMYSHKLDDAQLRLPAIVFQPASIPCHLSRHCAVKTSSGQYNFHFHEMHPADSPFHTVLTDSQLPSGDGSAHAASSASDGQQQQQLGNPKSAVEKPVCVFLHGFLGSGDDWLPIMQSLAMTHQCFALDLPGHGRSKVDSQGSETFEFEAAAIAVMAALTAILPGSSREVVLLGYSLGARLALYLSSHFGDRFKMVVSISGSAGIAGAKEASSRLNRDTALAATIDAEGLAAFVDSWYSQPMWSTLCRHPKFHIVLGQRQGADIHSGGEAPALRGMSSGSQPLVKDLLSKATHRLAFITGSEDIKFVRLARHLANSVNLKVLGTQSGTTEPDMHKLCQASVTTNFVGNTTHACTACVFEVGECGHAVHIERPEALLQVLMLLLSDLGNEV